ASERTLPPSKQTSSPGTSYIIGCSTLARPSELVAEDRKADVCKPSFAAAGAFSLQSPHVRSFLLDRLKFTYSAESLSATGSDCKMAPPALRLTTVRQVISPASNITVWST